MDYSFNEEKEWAFKNVYHENFDFLTDDENRKTPHAIYGRKGIRHLIENLYLTDAEWNPLEGMRKEKWLNEDARHWTAHQAVAEIILWDDWED